MPVWKEITFSAHSFFELFEVSDNISLLLASITKNVCDFKF